MYLKCPMYNRYKDFFFFFLRQLVTKFYVYDLNNPMLGPEDIPNHIKLICLIFANSFMSPPTT